MIWAVLAIAVAVPIAAAATSPLLAWRDPVYIVAGFAGVVSMCLMLFQPLLAAGYLPSLPVSRQRRVHCWVGSAFVLAVVIHVAGLWITSPPDVLDALLFVSPTPFSPFGVISMWAVFSAALLAALRRRLRLRPLTWRRAHTALVTLAVIGGVLHALLIEGTMEVLSKLALCLLVLAATVKAIADLRAWAIRPRRGN